MGLKEDLGKYEYWLGRSPGQILEEVKSTGGWTLIFSGEFPRWAHRVRNYFNREPTKLDYHKFDITNSDIYRAMTGQVGLDYKKDLALSGHIYKDESNNIWLQMSPGSTVYHFNHGMTMETMAGLLAMRGQSGTPVFKLISPDGSNGSRETIINNPFTKADTWTQILTGSAVPSSGEDTVKKGSLLNRIQTDLLYQGSYNYGETSVVGSDAHKKFDVTPHEKDPKGYLPVNPDRFSSLHSRKFPDRVDGEKTPLAEQIKYS